jgi:hypothetical protein
MQLINAFIESNEHLEAPALARKLRKLQKDWDDEEWSLYLGGVALVVADLLEQGWGVAAVGDAIELSPPGLLKEGETVENAKTRIRDALRVSRTRQLEEPGVRKFLQRMHRIGKDDQPSIADLIDDGAELAHLFKSALKSKLGVEAALQNIVRPIIEVCDEDARCADTGLRLIDIWRYFRHTWSLEYRSVPGRQLPLLIRNAARPNRPVIGIAMLASPVVRTRPRDNWIGWTPEALLRAIEAEAIQPREIIKALRRRVDASIRELRTDDLASARELANPTERVIFRIEQRAEGAAVARDRQLQRSYAQMLEEDGEIRSQRDPTKKGAKKKSLKALSEDLLFLRKRADTLWRLLDVKLVFSESGCLTRCKDPIARLLEHPRGERALSIALQEVRKAGLSSQVADLSVCGAVAPYNLLLGGKLVALLMSSAETLEFYRSRYARRASIISSQMAGRPIYRPAELKILTTTSLYGNASSQYNRLKLKASEHPELDHDIEWLELDRTVGFGTHHLSPETLRVLRRISEDTFGGRRVNHRFGEGASPRLRQTREGLDALGIESNSVLHHATPRLFYGLEVHIGAKKSLLGLSKVDASDAPTAEAIGAAWRRRWLAKRVAQPEILSRLSFLGPHTIKNDLLVPDEDGQFAMNLDAG